MAKITFEVPDSFEPITVEVEYDCTTGTWIIIFDGEVQEKQDV